MKLLPAGSYLQVDARASVSRPDHLLGLTSSKSAETPTEEATALDELDFLFRQAVSRQLVSDVEVGSYLSGGMDSGSITAHRRAATALSFAPLPSASI